jgi:hypothetical protein
MNPDQANSKPDPLELGPNSIGAVLFEVTGGEEDTTQRPTPEHIRKYLTSKPWLLQWVVSDAGPKTTEEGGPTSIQA